MSEPTLAPTEGTPAPVGRTATRQAWVERFQRFADSGLRPAPFCAQEGVSLPSFYAWKRRLGAEANGTAIEPAGPRLLPVRLQAGPAPLELVLPHGVVLRIPAGVDEATLGCLLRLLGGTPC